MGRSDYIYLGPFVLCTNIERVVKKLVKVCRTCKKQPPDFLDASFCPKCGNSITTESRNEKTTVRLYGDFPGIDERMSCFCEEDCSIPKELSPHKQFNIWLPNRRGNDHIMIEQVFQFPGELPAFQMQSFHDKYGDCLNIIREHYGQENVRVMYGIVPYSI